MSAYVKHIISLSGFPLTLLLFYRTVRLLSTASELIGMALRVERETLCEIDLLSKMNVYPSAELAIMRKESKALREVISEELQQEDGQQFHANVEKIEMAYEGELQLAEKKLAIIRGRRLDEEEIRNAKKKKLARAKQMEESQSRDPLNFRNQSRF